MFSPGSGPGEHREMDHAAHEEALGVMGVFIILTVMMISRVYKYIKTHHIMPLIACQLYLNKAVMKTKVSNEKNTYWLLLVWGQLFAARERFLNFTIYKSYKCQIPWRVLVKSVNISTCVEKLLFFNLLVRSLQHHVTCHQYVDLYGSFESGTFPVSHIASCPAC